MNIKYNEATAAFEIVGLSLDELNTIINCIAYAVDNGATVSKTHKNNIKHK